MSNATTHIETKKQPVPALRFKEFEREWENSKLGDGIKLISGQHMSPDQYNTTGDGTPYFTGPSDFTDSEEKITKWTNSSNHFGELNDILFTVKGSGVGTMTLLKLNKVAMGRQLMAIRPGQFDSEFVYHFLLKKSSLFVALASGNMIPGLSRQDILTLKHHIPSLPEQLKIASFLSVVDEKMQQLTKKKALLEQYKKGVMQQLFSGKLRFKNENGNPYPDWEENKRLGDLTYKAGKKNKENIQYPIYSINNQEGFRPQSEQFDGLDSNDRGYDISLYKIVHSETFAYNPARINIGSIGYSYDLNEVIISSLYVCFKTNEELEDLFLLAYLDTYNFHKDILRYEEGGVRQYLFYENFSHIKIPIPSNEEQQKIATYLTSIDSKTESVNNQITQTQTFKKGLLQQMFV